MFSVALTINKVKTVTVVKSLQSVDFLLFITELPVKL